MNEQEVLRAKEREIKQKQKNPSTLCYTLLITITIMNMSVERVYFYKARQRLIRRAAEDFSRSSVNFVRHKICRVILYAAYYDGLRV